MPSEEEQEKVSQQSHVGKMKSYINKKNEEAEDAMSSIANAHVSEFCFQATFVWDRF